jgi:hypothetical protein
MVGVMFVSDEVVVEGSFGATTARLIDLITLGTLFAPSRAAYEDGLTTLLRVGPIRRARGLSKLVEVRWLEPIRRGETMSIPMRWEATGAIGELFPILDADLLLAAHSDEQVLIGLTGSYRPPLGRVGEAMDRALLHRVAAATARSLLAGVAEAVADPTPGKGGSEPIPAWRPVVDPSEP